LGNFVKLFLGVPFDTKKIGKVRSDSVEIGLSVGRDSKIPIGQAEIQFFNGLGIQLELLIKQIQNFEIIWPEQL